MLVNRVGARQHFPNHDGQRRGGMPRQEKQEIRQVPPAIFTRKDERPQALDGNGKGALDMRPGVVAAESALFVLSTVTATGALYSWDIAVAKKSELMAEEQTLWTEVQAANAKENQWTTAVSFLATMWLAVFFGHRLVRMAQARFSKEGADAPAARA